MQITIKKVTDNGNALEGVSISVSVNEMAKMMDKGIHLFGSNEPKDPEGFPEEEVNWDECCLKHEPVKKEDLLKDEQKITCRTFLHKYSEGKETLVKRWLAEKRIEYRKNSGISTDYIEYDLDIYQIKELYLYLSSSEGGTNVLLI